MSGASGSILTINGGSSSIKFALFAPQGGLQMTQCGRIERIGSADSSLVLMDGSGTTVATRSLGAIDRSGAAEILIHWLQQGESHAHLLAIGHRVVHGGPNFHTPLVMSAEVIEELRRLTELDPQHMPQELFLSEAFGRRFPQLPQVACFDTAFHHDLPLLAQLLPIPRRYAAQGVRRYGFHGLSYEYLMSEIMRIDGARAAGGRIILAHLGSGASLVAMRAGKPVDTSMGFTPAAGVPMGTRSGDLDPGLAGYLARTEGMDARQFDELVNFKSGMLGVSETSGDMRELLACQAVDSRAAEAIGLFCYQVRKCIGAYAAALGGLDMLVFSGGIGEQASQLRGQICADLGFLGVALDPRQNLDNAMLVSQAAATVRVRVLRTNEELVIARSVSALLGL